MLYGAKVTHFSPLTTFALFCFMIFRCFWVLGVERVNPFLTAIPIPEMNMQKNPEAGPCDVTDKFKGISIFPSYIL